jgi:hypothetical protein
MTALDILVSPTPERLQHANDNHVQIPGTRATRMADAPIDRLRTSGALTESQYQAAATLFKDYYNAGLAPLGAVDYERFHVDGSKPSSVSDFRYAAIERYNRSCKELGEFFRVTVDAVVLREQSVEGAGRALGLGNASQARAVALDRLRGGLDILVKRYGLEGVR